MLAAIAIDRKTPQEVVVDDSAREGRKHVFAVNGSPAILDMLRELLEEEGYRATVCVFTPDVFARIAAARPDALIVDVPPDDPAGWALLQRLHADVATTAVPLLVTSTAPRLLDQARADAARYRRYLLLAKPYALDELLAAVRAMAGPA